jgi:hypothetical protein
VVDAAGDPGALAVVAAWRALGLRVVLHLGGADASELWPAAQRVGAARALAWHPGSTPPGFTLYGEGSTANFLAASECASWAQRTFAHAPETGGTQ